MRQNFLCALSLFGQRLGTPLAQPHTMAIALGGEEKAALLILHREAGAPQAQRFAQGRTGDALPADRQGGYIARRGKRGLSEPAGRCGRVREQAQPGESLLTEGGRALRLVPVDDDVLLMRCWMRRRGESGNRLDFIRKMR